MAKKKQEEERKLDLAAPDQAALEEKIKNMLDLGEPEKKIEESPLNNDENLSTEPQKVQIKVDEASSAPELPTEAKEADEDKQPIDDTDSFVDEPEKIINLDKAPKGEAILDEIQQEAEESINEEPEEPEPKTDFEKPLPEEEPDQKSEELPEEKEEVVVTKKQAKTSEETSKSNLELESKETAKAVDEIMAKESDELLEIEDKKVKPAHKGDNKESFFGKIGGLFKAWWNNPKARWSTIVVCLLVIVVVSILPTSRYFVLNGLGVRASATVTVLDESTGQPLKNVNVELASITAKTDSSGTAQLEEVKLGDTQLKVEKIAFAPSSKNVTVGLGDNKLDSLNIKPTGAQYSFVVTDYLSGKPVEKAEAISGESSAFSDQLGKIKLTVNPSEKESLDVIIVREDYREEKITIPTTTNTETGVVVVPSKKHAFISKRTGKYDLYSIDVDGKNEKLLLSGTGNERDDVALSYKPSASFAALVSTRDNQKNKDGFLLSNLNVVAVESGEVKAVTSSERIQLIDWIGDRLIFVKAVSGASASDPKRHQLMSYDSKSNQTLEVASSNYFNDVIVAGEKIYYAPSSANQDGGASLYRTESDGSGKITILNQEVWNIFRVDYENLALSAQNSWLNIRIGEDKATALTSKPTNLVSRIYSDSLDKKSSLWIDNRDGKGVLLNYQIDTKNDLSITSTSGLRGPANWLNKKDIVYRVSNEQETADYAVSLDGGEPKKITDVTNTNSLDKWYYY